MYRHAHALGLMDKRRRNVPAALEKIIEKAGDVEVSATAVVSAMAAIAKINANGQWIERSEHVSLNEPFDRMTPQEMENYTANGTLPTWFERMLGATPSNWTAAISSWMNKLSSSRKGAVMLLTYRILVPL